MAEPTFPSTTYPRRSRWRGLLGMPDEPMTGAGPLAPQGYGTGATMLTTQPGTAGAPGAPGATTAARPGPGATSIYGLRQAQAEAGPAPEPTPLPARVSRVAGPTAAQEEAARSSAFGRAKDMSARLGESALTGLRSELQRRGMGGAGYEAGETGERLTAAASPLQDVVVQQAQDELNQASRRADTEYQGQVAQRTTDIGATGAQDQLRMQAYQARLAALRDALKAWM